MSETIYTTTRTVDGVVLRFVWHGGAYIDVSAGRHGAQEVINVWDSRTDKPTIERTQDALEAKVDEWIEDYGPENLVHDVRVNWS